MNKSLIKQYIAQLSAIVERWDDSVAPATIETDIALDKVKSIYEQILFAPQVEPEPQLATEPTPEPNPISMDEIVSMAAGQSDVEVELLFADEDEDDIEPEPEPELEPEPERVVVKRDKASRHKAISSLYGESILGEEPEPEPESEPESESESEPEEDALSEQLEIVDVPLSNKSESAPQTLADRLAQGAVKSIASSLGINDRYLLARDLFGGDDELCHQSIAAIDRQPSFDSCMIYIAEEFDWNPDCSGAQLLLKLIERKFK